MHSLSWGKGSSILFRYKQHICLACERIINLLLLESCCVCVLSPVQLFVTPQTVTCKAPLTMGFSRHEYWSGLPFPSSEDRTDPGIESHLLHWQADSLPLHHWEAPESMNMIFYWVDQKFIQIFLQDISENLECTFWSTQYMTKGTLQMWLRILRWEDYPGLSRWVQCSHKVSHEGKRARRLRVKKER